MSISTTSATASKHMVVEAEIPTPSPSLDATPARTSGADRPSPSKKSKTTKTPSPSKAKTTSRSQSGNGIPSKNDGWTPEARLRLYEAYQACAAVKWDDVAEKMGGGLTGKQCREQWQRTTGKRIRKALGEE